MKATDAAGNTSAAASYTWTIDTVAPAALITGVPANPSNASSPSFNFTSEAGANFTCALDGGAFAACSSPKGYSALSDGSHNFQVKATDAAGNTGTAASYTWTIDTVPPDSTFLDAPGAGRDPTRRTTRAPGASFSFTSEPGATFQCKLDAAAFASCSSPKVYSGLADGSHTFLVRATDAAGNTGDPATWTWMIDTAAPTASITASPTNPSNNASPSFSFSSEAGATFTCALDGAAFASCSSPKSYTGLADGSHTFQVKATDAAGNTGAAASYTWTVDTVAPTATITASPANPSNNAGPSFSFSSEAGATLPVRARRRRVRGLHQPEELQRPRGRQPYLPGEGDRRRRQHRRGGELHLDGRHDRADREHHRVADEPEQQLEPELQLQLRGGRDVHRARSTAPPSRAAPARRATAASPTAATPSRSRRPTRPATPARPPATPGRSTRPRRPPASRASPTNPSNTSSPSFSFTSEAGATFTCALDGAAFAGCSSPKSYTTVADGSHTFQVKATDAAGNTGTAASYTWTVDTIAPTATISASPTNPSNSASPSFSFSSEAGATFTCALDGAAFAGCSSPEELHRPRRRKPHLPGEGDRRGRQRQRRCQLHLDDRHGGADGDDHRQPDEPEQQRQPELQLQLGGRCDLPVRTRQHLHELQQPEELHGCR